MSTTEFTLVRIRPTAPFMNTDMAPTQARRLLTLGRDLATAVPSSDILDMLAVGAGIKPMAGMAACYTADGAPAWDAVEPDPDLSREGVADRLDEAGFQWRMTPVETVREDGRQFTWYELLVGVDDHSVSEFVERTGQRPAERTQREYGEGLGYPDTAVRWFVERDPDTDYDSVFDVIATSGGYSDNAPMLAASVPYVPAPSEAGARDALADGRELTDALGHLDDVAERSAYAETLLGERIRETLTSHDATDAWRDPLHRAMGRG